MYEQLSAESAALPLADQPTALRATLRPYQRQALHWMLAREAEGDARAELHPSWRQYALPDGRSFYLQVTTGVARLRRPVGEEAARGGILADEMGLGKTVQLIALVLADIEAERNRHRAAAPPPPAAADAEEEAAAEAEPEVTVVEPEVVVVETTTTRRRRRRRRAPPTPSSE